MLRDQVLPVGGCARKIISCLPLHTGISAVKSFICTIVSYIYRFIFLYAVICASSTWPFITISRFITWKIPFLYINTWRCRLFSSHYKHVFECIQQHNTTLTDAAKMEVGLLCWAYFCLFWEGCRICGFHIRKNTGTVWFILSIVRQWLCKYRYFCQPRLNK